jgi:outer membrane biosynthesis protein TonB
VEYPLRLWIAIWLICCSAPFAQSNATSTNNGQYAPASNSKTQEPVQPPSAKERLGGVDVLSDTGGFDFSPYLRSVLKIVKQNWYASVPERGPRVPQGEVSIEFAILRNGKVKGMKLAQSSGTIPMDRVAWGSIYNSKLPPLPVEYSGQYLALRFHFPYNPDKPSDFILQISQ